MFNRYQCKKITKKLYKTEKLTKNILRINLCIHKCHYIIVVSNTTRILVLVFGIFSYLIYFSCFQLTKCLSKLLLLNIIVKLRCI